MNVGNVARCLALSAYSALCVLVVAYCGVAAAGPTDSAAGENGAWDADLNTGLRWHSADGVSEVRIGGRLHADTARFRDDITSINDDSAIRRARVAIGGHLGEAWRFRVEREFANNREGWRNLWVQYRPTRKSWFKLGNFVAPFGLEDIAASNHSTFMERSLASALAPSYQTGVGFGTRGKFGDRRRHHHYNWFLSVGSESLGDGDDDRHDSSFRSLVSRLAYAPVAEDRKLVHLAVAAEYRDLDGNSGFRERSKPESSLAPALLNTGLLADVENVTSFGVEAATVNGPLSFQTEYMRSSLSRSNGRANPTFDGWYLQASYVLTGEHRKYRRSSASFGGIDPRHRWGALELTARISQLDLIDETVRGGEARDISLGLNWYYRQNVRLMFNYIDVDAKRRSNLAEDAPRIYQLRLLVFL